MYLQDSAAHWYHAFKQNRERMSWEQFSQVLVTIKHTSVGNPKRKV
jgi:hypothetical protein